MVKAKKPYVWQEQPTVIAALRRTFRRYPPFQDVHKRCKQEWFETCKNGNKRRRVHFKCEKCGKFVSAKNFTVDHIEPVVSLRTGFVDYNTYAKQLFCPVSNLQGLCKDPCHKEKCRLENAIRRKIKKERK